MALASMRLRVVVRLLTVVLLAVTRPSLAHSPHDDIDALAASPQYAADRTLFIAITRHLRRSVDGGASWKELEQGLDNRYEFSAVALSPAYGDDATVFASTHGDGVYKSTDAGGTWRRTNNGLTEAAIESLAIHPDYAARNLVFARTRAGALFRSRDGGDTWDEVLPDSAGVSVVGFAGVQGERLLAGDRAGSLRMSTDQGSSWQEHVQVSGTALTALAVSTDPEAAHVVFAGDEAGGIHLSTDHGTTFSAPLHQFGAAISAIAPSPSYSRDSTVYVSTVEEAVFVSEDGGSLWRSHSTGLTTDKQAESKKYRSPHFHQMVFSDAFAEDGSMYLAGFDGLFHSRDRGREWLQVETLPVGLVKGLALGAGPGDSEVIGLATYGGGGYFSGDGGRSWIIANHGIRTTRLADIAFSPQFAVDNTVFSGALGRLLRSDNGGRYWHGIDHSQPRPIAKFVRKVLRRVGLRSVSDRLYRRHELSDPYPTVIAVSPAFAEDRTVFFGTRWHGIYRSEDSGETSRQLWDTDGSAVVGLQLSPGYDADGTLFISVRGKGLFKSTDRGNQWVGVNEGLATVARWSAEPRRNRISRDLAVALSPGYRDDTTLFAGGSHGLFRSTDGGSTWNETRLGAYVQRANVIALALSPTYVHDRTLVVSAKGYGLFSSKDAGESFERIGAVLLADNHLIEYLAYSPITGSPPVLFAASSEQVFYSRDGGAAWESLPRPVRYEDGKEPLRYAGTWRFERSDTYSAQSAAHSDTVGSTLTFDFVGTGITWLGATSGESGIARVVLDGLAAASVDQFSQTPAANVVSWTSGKLAPGAHQIVIQVTGEHNASAAGSRVTVDALDVAP